MFTMILTRFKYTDLRLREKILNLEKMQLCQAWLERFVKTKELIITRYMFIPSYIVFPLDLIFTIDYLG